MNGMTKGGKNQSLASERYEITKFNFLGSKKRLLLDHNN
jgi:hypothetical protein